MLKAHETLGISMNATETEIRARYLQLVREFPPDRAPEQFARIRAAFDELRDPMKQLNKVLFSLATQDTLKDLEMEIHSRLKTASLSIGALVSLAERS